MCKKPDYILIGKRIRQFRLKQDISQEKLAEACSFSVGHISNIERANTKLSIIAIFRIANALDCSVDELLHDKSRSSLEKTYLETIENFSDNELEYLIEEIKLLKKFLLNRKE